jgi:hypothetical protein
VILSPKTSGILSKLTTRSELSSCPHAAFQLFGSAYQRKALATNDDDSEHTAPKALKFDSPDPTQPTVPRTSSIH